MQRSKLFSCTAKGRKASDLAWRKDCELFPVSLSPPCQWLSACRLFCGDFSEELFRASYNVWEKSLSHLPVSGTDHNSEQSPGEGEAVEVEPFPDGVSLGLNRQSVVQRAALPLLSCVSRGCRSPSGWWPRSLSGDFSTELKFWVGCVVSLQHFTSGILCWFDVASQSFQCCRENLFPALNEKRIFANSQY